MSDFFKIERVKEDIPFYNGKPKLPAVGWIALLAGVVLYFLVVRHIIDFDIHYSFIISTLVVLIPIIYVCWGRFSLLFKKLTRGDIKPIIIVTVIGFIYSMLGAGISGFLGFVSLEKSMEVLAVQTFFADAAILVVQLLGEELFKISMLLILMFIIYKFANNRKVTLAASILITSFIFGACHEGVMGPLAHVLIVQGVATIFDMILYINTKNVVATYVSHLAFDLLAEVIQLVEMVTT